VAVAGSPVQLLAVDGAFQQRFDAPAFKSTGQLSQAPRHPIDTPQNFECEILLIQRAVKREMHLDQIGNWNL
jgi:hypothetical protein